MAIKVSRIHLTTLVALVAIIWAIVIYAKEGTLDRDHLEAFGTVLTILFLIVLVFNRWLWSWPVFRGWLVKRPDLRGTWRVMLYSNWVNPKTGKRKGPIRCYMAITQTASSHQMHLMTPESESWLISHEVEKADSDIGYQIVGVYRNEPESRWRGVQSKKRSEIHYGAIRVTSHGPEHFPDSLTAEYWTDRETTGRMEFTDKDREMFTRFQDADLHFEMERK